MRRARADVVAVALATAVLAVLAACKKETADAGRPEAFPCPANGTDAGSSASVDQCTTDSQCPTDSVCACFTADNTHTTGNVCSTPGNCRIDADCPSGEVCSASYTLTCQQPLEVIYECHTGSDECLNDSDCSTAKGPISGLQSLCTWQPSKKLWACASYGCEG